MNIRLLVFLLALHPLSAFADTYLGVVSDLKLEPGRHSMGPEEEMVLFDAASNELNIGCTLSYGAQPYARVLLKDTLFLVEQNPEISTFAARSHPYDAVYKKVGPAEGYKFFKRTGNLSSEEVASLAEKEFGIKFNGDITTLNGKISSVRTHKWFRLRCESTEPFTLEHVIAILGTNDKFRPVDY